MAKGFLFLHPGDGFGDEAVKREVRQGIQATARKSFSKTCSQAAGLERGPDKVHAGGEGWGLGYEERAEGIKDGLQTPRPFPALKAHRSPADLRNRGSRGRRAGHLASTSISLSFFFLFLSFCHFLGRSLGIWRFPGQSHSNAGSELRLRPTPQLTATPDP